MLVRLSRRVRHGGASLFPQAERAMRGSSLDRELWQEGYWHRKPFPHCSRIGHVSLSGRHWIWARATSDLEYAKTHGHRTWTQTRAGHHITPG